MSITLNQTAGSDNDAIFLLKIHSEGENLVTNGDFSSSSGWTTETDWSIGSGRATYSYSSNADSSIYRTIGTITAVEYVLEYEVISRAGNYSFYLYAHSTSVYNGASGSLALSRAIGKHSVKFVGNAGASKVLNLHISGAGASDELVIDNVKLRLADDTIRLSTEDITLSSNDWDGKVTLAYNDISSISQSFSSIDGGGLGSVNAFSFNLIRYTDNTKLTNFFNAFYPNYDGKYIISRNCEIGIIWDGGAGAVESDITWLISGRVIEFSFDHKGISLTVFQESEFTAVDLPYYRVQKDYDNEISYFTNAPDINYGLPLPLLYGDFTTYEDDHDLFKPLVFPVVCIERHNLRYLCASHKFETETFSTGGGSASLSYQYLPGIKTYMTCTCDNGSATNNNTTAYLTHYDSLDSTSNVVKGTINIRPQKPGTQNEKTGYINVVNNDNTDTVVCASTEKIALSVDGSESGIGQLSRAANSIRLYCVVTSATAGTLQIGMNYYNPEYNSGTGSDGIGTAKTYSTGTETENYDLSSDFAGRDVSDEPWRWEELWALEYWVKARSGNSVTFRDMWLNITNIIVSDTRRVNDRARGGMESIRNSIRNSGRGRNG